MRSRYPANMTSVLLISTYEQGRQPLGLAAPVAILRADGHDVRTLDLSVEPPDASLYDWADLIAISTPMHTAARLGTALARQLRDHGHAAKLVFYGVGAAELDGRTLTGDTDRQLLALARGEDPGAPTFDRAPRSTPDRAGLPPLDQYARYHGAENQFELAGYVEASRGCAHRCTHCPLTPVFEGRLRLNGAEGVLADIEQQVAMGARHITFGDPDFFNAPAYGIELLELAQSRVEGKHQRLTFDVTIKVQHLLEHQNLLPRLRDLGVSFITSAFESVDDALLRILDKGHTAADLDAALRLTTDAGIPIRPTWLPFTPWTSPSDYLALLEFIETRGLIAAVPPVQLGLRLLVPPASPLADPIRKQGWLGEYDTDGLIWHWRHPDEKMDRLQADTAALVEAAEGAPPADIFRAVKQLACERLDAQPWPDAPQPQAHIPGLTEAWFC